MADASSFVVPDNALVHATFVISRKSAVLGNACGRVLHLPENTRPGKPSRVAVYRISMRGRPRALQAEALAASFITTGNVSAQTSTKQVVAVSIAGALAKHAVAAKAGRS